MIIVKLGGSLYQTTELKHWLTTLQHYSQQQNIVIVPGGGPFADQVRKAQLIHGFNDHYAHHMAILAMTQFGILLSSFLPNCHTFASPSDTASMHNPLTIWLPDKQLLDHVDLAQNWDMTSDSLALWLSHQYSVKKLSLIKSNPPQHITSIDKLNKLGFIDNAFSALAAKQFIPMEVIAAKDYQSFNVGSPISPLQS